MLYTPNVPNKQGISINVPLLVFTIMAGVLIVTIPSLVEGFVNRDGDVPQVSGVTNQISLTPQEVTISRAVLLKDNSIDPAAGQASLRVVFSDEQATVISDSDITIEYHINGNGLQSFALEQDIDNTYVAIIDAAEFEPGVYSAVITVGELQSGSVEFTVTYPLYVTWTFDWEGYDVKPEYLDTIARQSNEHGVPITHFFNPRIYTNPNLSQERAQELTDWVIARRDQNGDDIGLHLHMQPDMVRAAGVEVRENAAQWGSNLTDGYDVLTSEYSYDDMVKMLNWSKIVFNDKGLGTPTMYRAGGWFADEDILQAVHDTGFDLDSSARTEYEFGHNNVRGHWDIGADQSPYQLNLENQNDVHGTSDLWEFPDSGADSWSYTAEEIIDRFELQHGDVLYEPHVVVLLSHPEWYHVDAPKMDQVFTHIDQFLHNADRGNVVYANLSSVYTVWEGK